jgi:hypothetical protein
MTGTQQPRPGQVLVSAALRCYPAPWRRRHGDEAAELAALLARDGTPAWVIAGSYLRGAAGARLRLHRRLGAALAALLVAAVSLGISLGLVSAAPSASAARRAGAQHCQARPAAHGTPQRPAAGGQPC